MILMVTQPGELRAPSCREWFTEASSGMEHQLVCVDTSVIGGCFEEFEVRSKDDSSGAYKTIENYSPREAKFHEEE